MYSLAFSILFVTFLFISVAVRFWLGSRQIRHVLAHHHAVPPRFAATIPLAAHQRAADYTVAKTKFSLLSLLAHAAVLISFTFLGGLQHLSIALLQWLGAPAIWYQLLLIAAFVAISGLIDLPFDYYRQFVLEQRFGFNKMRRNLFFMDLLKHTVIGAIIGLPLLWVFLTLMDRAGDLWWIYAWLVWSGFQLLMLVFYPSVIAPLFNKFTALEDDSLRQRIEGLMARVGFASSGLFVMDGSKRSAHGNAYFSGFGAAKRIVFFDTLLARLAPQEVEAVLAHELGHFKLKHIVKRISVMFALSLALMALLGFLKSQLWFYTGLGVQPLPFGSHDAMALSLFILTLPVFLFLLSPIAALTSRKHEFEADAFAVKHTNAPDLVTALVKLYEDNAATLTPDPLHSAFYDSHPPASVRIDKIMASA
jgi:STE24 endopeptidase